MRGDRRSFLIAALGVVRALAVGVGAVLPARRSAAEPSDDVHHASRNSALGAVGPRRSSLGGGEGTGPLRRSKPWVGAARTPLPRAVDALAMGADSRPLIDVIRSDAPALALRADPVSLAELSRLLLAANGATGSLGGGARKLRLRAAPSAGALYAGEVYVVAERVAGLAPGVYGYEVARHALVEIDRGRRLGRVAAAVERPALARTAAFAVLLSNVFARYTRRYANRGYRYALIDSGHIGENLRLAAAAAGLASARIDDFHDAGLADLLSIDGRTEAVCAIHVVGHRAGVEAPAPRLRGLVPEHASVMPGETAIERYHRETRLVVSEGGGPEGAATDRPAAAPFPVVPLPGTDAVAERAGAPVHELIRARRSAGRFDEGPLDFEQLAFAIGIAQGASGGALGSELDLHVVAHRVEGLAPGHYLVRPDGTSLGLVERRSLAREMVRACLDQEKAGSAAAAFVMVAHLGAARAVARTRRYRALLIDAGAMGERIYLAAGATGLAARNLAAFRDDAFNALLGLDGEREAAIHLTMFGPGA